MNQPINPLDDADPALQGAIREEAYHLWEADGRPHHRDAEYWERARELVAMKQSGMTGQLPNPASAPGADPLHQDIVEEAFIQENLGEFPDRFADQGERRPTPASRRKTSSGATPSGAKTSDG